MAVSFLSPSRTVLLVADEALYIYTTGHKGVRLVESVSWDAENFEKNVTGIITKDCGRKPILILNDMVEQHYRKERVIKGGVSILDKSNVLKRKLHVAFPNYPIRAAFPLKEKLPKSDTGPAADIYIFAAVPDTGQFTKSVEIAKESFASISGFCLLPIESSNMVKALSDKLSKVGKGKKAQWSVFMGQHKNGGLRQIVTKNGELALTRMTPVTEDINDVAAWTNDVHQEFKATMSYLARFGYQVEDGLDVTIIAAPPCAQPLTDMITEECNLHIVTVADAARALGIPLGRQENPAHADVLHVAWSGRKSRFILPMQAVQIDQVSKPRQVAMVSSLALMAGGAFLAYQLFDQYEGLSVISNDYNDASARQAQLDSQYKREVQRKEELGYDVRLVQSSIAIFENFESEQLGVLDLYKGIGGALGKDLRIDKVRVRRGPPLDLQTYVTSSFDQYAQKKAPPALFTATMNMTYPSTTDIDQGNKEVGDLRLRLEVILPNHKVKVSKFLKDYEYVEGIVVETGELDKENVKQDFIAEIIIEGPPEEREEKTY